MITQSTVIVWLNGELATYLQKAQKGIMLISYAKLITLAILHNQSFFLGSLLKLDLFVNLFHLGTVQGKKENLYILVFD